MRIIDITPTISPELAVFPGDTSFSSEILLDQKKGDNIDLSTIRTTVHLGAHADAPSHYHKKGNTIDEQDLTHYYGKCQVIEVEIERGKRIYPLDVKEEIIEKRVLFKTNSYPDPNQWNGDFNSLSVELIQLLATKRVITVGIDTPSVDPADEKDLKAHKEIYKNNMAIIEGVVLTSVAPKVYTLIALPLKIKESDASPIRAVLLEI